MKKSVSIQSKYPSENGMAKASPSTKETLVRSISRQVRSTLSDWLKEYGEISRTSRLAVRLRFLTKRAKVTVVYGDAVPQSRICGAFFDKGSHQPRLVIN